jgi:hypothetical protein
MLIVAALLVGLGGALADAKKKKKRKGKSWASQITLVQPTTTSFAGTVTSTLGACRQQRLVIVYYTDPQTLQTLPLSVQRTDSQGGYLVALPKPAFAGTYHAVVAEEKIKAKKAKQTCKAAQSSTVSAQTG